MTTDPGPDPAPELPAYLREPGPPMAGFDPAGPVTGAAAFAALGEWQLSPADRTRLVLASVGPSGLAYALVVAQSYWLNHDRDGYLPSFVILVVALPVVFGWSAWMHHRRLGRIVLALTEAGIFVGRDDGRPLGWLSRLPQIITWDVVTDVRIIETRWSRKIMILTTGVPLVLVLPRSNWITRVPELDAVAEWIRQIWWLTQTTGPRATALPPDGADTVPPPPTGRPVLRHLP